MTALQVLEHIHAAGFEPVAANDNIRLYGTGAFPEHLAAALRSQKRAVLALLDPTVCRRHGRDYRAFCGLPACAAAFPNDLPLDAIDRVTGRIKR